MKHLLATLFALILLMIGFPIVLDSCASPPAFPVFAALRRPANVRGEFLRGRVGVVRGGWRPVYLIGAYRMLSGRPLTETERRALYPSPKEENLLHRLRWAQSAIRLWRPPGQFLDQRGTLVEHGRIGRLLIDLL